MGANISKNISKVLVAVGCIFLGLVILPFVILPSVVLPTIIAANISTVVVGAGISGLLSCLFGEITWGEFWKEIGMGALTSCIALGASKIAKMFIGKLETVATQLEKFWKVSKVVIEHFLSTGAAIYITSAIQGKSFDFSKFKSEFFGKLLSYGIARGWNKLYENIANHCTKLWEKVTLDRLKPFTEFLKRWRVDQLYHYPLAEFSKNYLTCVGVNLMDGFVRGKKAMINWGGVLSVAISMSFVDFSRTAIKYYNEVRGNDQRLYGLAKQDELKIRNDDDQKLINSLDNKGKLQEYVRAPIGFEDGEFVIQDEDEDKDTKTSSTLESRAWNSGARIYSTKDAIETFRSQSERYNYANVAHEFDDSVDQTPTNTTGPEYVYARSSSNRPVTSSSSPTTSTNRSGQSTNRKGKSRTTNDNSYFPQPDRSSQSTNRKEKSRTTNDNSYFPQPNRSSQSTNRKGKSRTTNDNSYFPQPNRSSQSDRDFTNTTNKFNPSETVNEKLSVKIHPIVCWNTKEQKYILSNPNEWPAFPHKTKVVGFIGTKKSGRTTAIHSLLFELGYFLNEEQLAKSLLPVGVMMYVLKKHDLIFLDCCDVADSVTTEDGNIVSGYLLEFFTYMASCHLVIHTAIAQKTETDHSEFSEQLVNYIHAKAKLQLSWSSIIQTYGPSMLTVLVRGSKQECEALDLNNLFSSQSNEENSDVDKITFTQGFQDSKAFKWQYIPEEMITTRTLTTNDNFAVSTEILERIKDETKPHGLCAYVQAILAGAIKESEAISEDLRPFYNGIEANWQHLFTEIMSDNVLSRSIADVANHDAIQEADDQTGGLIQEYIDSVNKLVENSATQGSALATNYKALCEDIKRRMDIEMDKPDEEKDPIIGFKINIEIAKCLLESSKSETNTQTKENLISWGLHGLTLIHNRSPKAFEHTWMKLCIKTYNILDILNTPVIYNVYWHCWNFLSFASSCDFKLELIEWQILERALHCLKTSANKPRFHFHVLNCLLNFLETEPYLPVMISPSTKDENNQGSSLQLNDEQYYRLKQMTYYGITEFSKKIVREVAEQRQSTNMEKYLEEIKDIVNKQIKILSSTSPSSAATSSQDESFSALVEHQQFAIVSAALVRLNTEIALYVSKYIIINDDENKLINLFSPNSPIEMLQDYHEMIRNYRWLFLQRIASLQDDKCTRILMDNTLSWSIDFLKKLPYDDASKKSHSYAVLFINTLVIAESVMQKRQRATKQQKNLKTTSSSRQPMTLNDINKKKEKIEDEEEYGEVRMELLSQKCFKPVLKEFLRGLKSQDPKEYLRTDKVRRYAQYINNLLFAPHNPRIQALSLDQVPIYEQSMLRLMTFQMMDLCVKAFWQHHLKKEETVVAKQMSIIYNTRALLRLLNRIHRMLATKDQNEDIQGFSIIFGSQGSNTSRQNSIHSLPSSDDTNSSETLADEMIQRIGLKNWQNLITLTSISRVLSDCISKMDPDKSLNIHESMFDVRDEALILLWNLAECSGISLGVSKKVMTTNDFRSANVIGGFSDTTTFDENGINRIGFLVNRVVGQANTNTTTGEADVSEITTQELRNRFRIGKIRAIELKKQEEISEKVEKQIEEQKLMPNVQAMKEARLRRFGIK